MILGHADMSSSMFAESFRALGEKLFPTYAFRPLTADHPIFTQGPFAASAWRHPLPVEGLSNGCRELMVLLQGDPARYWQTQWVPRGLGATDPARSQEAAELAADLVAYATDPAALANQRLAGPDRADSSVKIAYSLSVARLRYDGNWDPEPAGWSRLVATLRSRQQVDLHAEPIELGVGKLPGYKVAHLTGTAHFRLSEAARVELRKFVNTGGVLIVESAGGSADFTASAEAELESTFGEKIPPTPLSPLHPVFSAGQRIDAVTYRPAAARVLGDLHAPRLRGLDAAGRTVIFFSPEDLSVGLSGSGADGIVGYDPASATSIMGNMLLYAADK
jgi:hypothetical protein